jgi:hypothetical protein
MKLQMGLSSTRQIRLWQVAVITKLFSSAHSLHHLLNTASLQGKIAASMSASRAATPGREVVYAAPKVTIAAAAHRLLFLLMRECPHA